MILVNDIKADIEEAIGNCEEPYFFRKLTSGVEILMNKGPWGSLVGGMDICTQNCKITLPDDVDVPLAVNIGGRPADFRNKYFEFHLNGPGTQACGQTCYRSWTDEGFFPTFRELCGPSRLVAIPSVDEGTSKTMWVYGFDEKGRELSTLCGDVYKEGMPVPIIFGTGAGTPSDQKIARITRVYKPQTNGIVNLIALDFDSYGGTLIGKYKPPEAWPTFRRIGIQGTAFRGIDWAGNCCQTWVRMKFRMKQPRFTSMSDVIMINSPQAIVRAVQAVIKLDKNLVAEGGEYLSAALSFLRDRDSAESGPNTFQMQFQARGFAAEGMRNL